MSGVAIVILPSFPALSFVLAFRTEKPYRAVGTIATLTLYMYLGRNTLVELDT